MNRIDIGVMFAGIAVINGFSAGSIWLRHYEVGMGFLLVAACSSITASIAFFNAGAEAGRNREITRRATAPLDARVLPQGGSSSAARSPDPRPEAKPQTQKYFGS